MILVFSIRDANAPQWHDFWKARPESDEPLGRFGFKMFVRGLYEDEHRIVKECKERMAYVKRVLRDEEIALRRTPTAAMKECKSSRAPLNAMKSMDRYDKMLTQMIKQAKI